MSGLIQRLAAALRGDDPSVDALDTALDAFISIDRRGVVTGWNPAAERILGWTRDEVLGRELAETIVPPRYRDAHRSGMARYLRTGEAHVLGQKLDLPACHRDGREFPAEVTIWSSVEGTETRFHAFLRDVSEQHRLRTHLAILQRITAMSNAATDIEQAVRSAMEEVSDLTGWPVGHVYLQGESRGMLQPTGWWTSGAVPYASFRAVTEGTPFHHAQGMPGRVTASREPVWMPVFAEELSMPRAEAAAHAGLRSGFAFPVLVGDRVVGVIEYFAPSIEEPADDVIGLLRNVGTQLGRAFERVRATEEVEQASELKGRLLSVVSHDLQAPLVSIEGFARILEEDWADISEDRRLTYIRRILRQTERVDRLVRDLMMMSRLEARSLRPEPTDLDLVSVLREDVKDLQIEGVEIHVPDGVEVHVDRHHLGRIVTNLLTNADRYGAPPIDITAVVLEDGQVVLRVRDHGQGVPESFVPDLFRRFSRAAADGRGTGLGLSIVAGLAEANGGDVRYESADPGAAFAVSLPSSSH